jgi:hypothetical protein
MHAARFSSKLMATACFWSQALGHAFFPAKFLCHIADGEGEEL